MNRCKTAIVAIMVAASVIGSLMLQHRAALQLRQRDEKSRRQAEDLTRLSEENERLSNLVTQVSGSRSLSKEQLTELLRLRNEAGQLHQTAREEAGIEASNAQLRATAARAEEQLAKAQAAPNYWPRSQLTFAGYGDPASAVKSMLAAMNSGDVGAWRASCTPEAIASLEKEWDQRGLPADKQDDEIKSMADMLISSSSGFHIIGQEMPSADEAIVDLSFDGEGTARKFVLRKVGNEWKFQDLIVAGQEDTPSP